MRRKLKLGFLKATPPADSTKRHSWEVNYEEITTAGVSLPPPAVLSSSGVCPVLALWEVNYEEISTAGMSPLSPAERESSLLTTCWSESTLSSRWFGGPASRHGSLTSVFRVALHLPGPTSLSVFALALALLSLPPASLSHPTETPSLRERH